MERVYALGRSLSFLVALLVWKEPKRRVIKEYTRRTTKTPPLLDIESSPLISSTFLQRLLVIRQTTNII